jgi:hypothetical protein
MVTLYAGGYGYEIGDIVLVDKRKEPNLGDVILYDRHLNKSDQGIMGPGIPLAKIVGLSGDKVNFNQQSYEANGFIIKRTDLRRIMWGTEPYDDLFVMNLIVPDCEYLADHWVGSEWQGTNEFGSVFYHRYTVKQEAILGVVIEKTGHMDIPPITY